MNRKKRTGPQTDSHKTPRQTRKSYFCAFKNPCKRACQEKKDRVQRAKQGRRPTEISL